MSSELYYASAPRGLKPGSRGFCTVARTDGMPAAVIERLESLSNYEPIYPGGSPLADRNPVGFAHWRIPVGTRSRSVLSRVAFVAADYTGRPGKFAHHVVLDPSEQHPAGPAEVISMPDLFRPEWIGGPTLLPPRVLKLDEAVGRQDAAPPWSRVLSDSYAEDPSRPVYLVYEPETDVLAGVRAALSLLPPAVRWQVTFNTYFTELPAGLTCTWRGVLAGPMSERATGQSKSNALVLDASPGTEPTTGT